MAVVLIAYFAITDFYTPMSDVQTPLEEPYIELGGRQSLGDSLAFYQGKVFFASEKLDDRLCFSEWTGRNRTHKTDVQAVWRFISGENLLYIVCRNADMVVYDAEKDKILAKENLHERLNVAPDAILLSGVDKNGAYFSFKKAGDSYIVRFTPQGQFETVSTLKEQNAYLLLVDKGRLVYTYFRDKDGETGTVVEDMRSHEKRKLNNLYTLGDGEPGALLWNDCLVVGRVEKNEVRIIPLDGGKEKVYAIEGNRWAIEKDTLYAQGWGPIYALDLQTGQMKATQNPVIRGSLYIHCGDLFLISSLIDEKRTSISFTDIENLQWEPVE